MMAKSQNLDIMEATKNIKSQKVTFKKKVKMKGWFYGVSGFLPGNKKTKLEISILNNNRETDWSNIRLFFIGKTV